MKNWWRSLEPRQRWVIRGGVAALVLLAVYHWTVDPVLTEKARLTQRLEAQTRAAKEIVELSAQWQAMNAQGRTVTSTGGSLFASLDRIADQVGLKSKVAYMKPTTPATQPGQPAIERVDMKLQDITTKDLVAFLLRVETDGGVGIRRIAVVREGTGPYRIQAVAVFETVATPTSERDAS